MRFSGIHCFLSNFYRAPIQYNLKVWPSAEHLFQALKTENPEEREEVRRCNSPAGAKRLGKQVSLRQDWEVVKLDVMRRVLWLKFQQNPSLGKRLIRTGDTYLEEGNHWHDNYWGNCFCSRCSRVVGQNHLGRLLMEVRAGIS